MYVRVYTLIHVYYTMVWSDLVFHRHRLQLQLGQRRLVRRLRRRHRLRRQRLAVHPVSGGAGRQRQQVRAPLFFVRISNSHQTVVQVNRSAGAGRRCMCMCVRTHGTACAHGRMRACLHVVGEGRSIRHGWQRQRRQNAQRCGCKCLSSFACTRVWASLCVRSGAG